MGELSLRFLVRNEFVLNTLKYVFELKSSFVHYGPLNMTEAFLLTSVYIEFYILKASMKSYQ